MDFALKLFYCISSAKIDILTVLNVKNQAHKYVIIIFLFARHGN